MRQKINFHTFRETFLSLETLPVISRNFEQWNFDWNPIAKISKIFPYSIDIGFLDNQILALLEENQAE